MIAFVISLVFIKEDFSPGEKRSDNLKNMFSKISDFKLMVRLFITYFIVTVSLNTIEPIVTVYVRYAC